MNNMTDETPGLPQAQKLRFSKALDRLYQCCTDRYALLSEQFNLPQAEAKVLLLFGAERYLTPKGVSIQLGVSKSRVTKIIEGLTAKGYVRKVADPADSRVVLLSLTPAGAKTRDSFRQAMESLRDQTLTRIAPDMREAVLNSLETLKSAMEGLEDDEAE